MINNCCCFRRNPLMSALVLLFPFSCATGANTSNFPPVYLTSRAQFYLLPAAEMEQTLDCAQQITVNFDGQEFTMEAWVQADEQGIEIALFTAMGVDMGNFSFSDSGVSLDSPVFPQAFRAEYLAADFQLCYFRPAALRNSLNALKLSFELTNELDDSGLPLEKRMIRDRGKLIIEIRKSEKTIQYTNLLRGYGFTLES